MELLFAHPGDVRLRYFECCIALLEDRSNCRSTLTLGDLETKDSSDAIGELGASAQAYA